MKAKLTLEVAKKMYESSEESIRLFAIHNFPELDLKITERVKTFEDACKIKGVDPNSEFFTSLVLRKSEKSFRKLELITEVLNGGEVLDIYNEDVFKHFPVFYCNLNGGLGFHDVNGWRSVLHVPAPLCFADVDKAEYAGKQFEPLYLEYLLP